MYLLLMRHGIAEEGEIDEERALTPKGERKVASMARLLGKFGFHPHLVLCSHRVRAIQTAEIFIKTLDLEIDLERTETIDLFGEWEPFEKLINERIEKLNHEKPTILVIGHQPQLGMFANIASNGAEDCMSMKKAGCVGIRLNDKVYGGEGEVRFYLTPSLAKRL